ncbi:MAG: FAD-binding protein, partial [Chitinophagaceae bacterium]
MDTISFDGIQFYLPESVADIQLLIKQARTQNVELRVCGASHSVPKAIHTDLTKNGGNASINLMLSKMYSVDIDKENNIVTVQAGCHLGFDPFDPTGISNENNGLFVQLDKSGYAVPDMGGITHQTVGGFLSTGSSGGSTKYSFDEQLLSITLIPADRDNPEPVTFSYSENLDDPFFAAGVSMGLLGIIISASFKIIPRFNIKGCQFTTKITEAKVDLFGIGGNGKPSLQQFLQETEYSRLLWYAQPQVGKLVIWQAQQMNPDEPFTKKPYQELPEILGSYIPAELGADLVYTLIGKWPDWLKDILANNPQMYDIIVSFINSDFYPTILPLLMDIFVPLDNGSGPQQFEDSWYDGLPMDNNMSDKLFPVEFTELWIPIEKTIPVMAAMNQAYQTYYANKPGPGGALCTELYAAKASKFWMSPSYGCDVIRVDVFWFGNNTGSPADSFYPVFWNALKQFNFRGHWGKYLPGSTNPSWKGYI